MSLVSVIMPCYNHGEFLKDSVDSILLQTYSDIELIIIDDCSTDKSSSIIKEFAAHDSRVKPITHPRNEGLSKSRNDGIMAITGEFVAFCDSDDIWEPDKLAIQMEQIKRNPKYDLVYCDSLIIDGFGTPTQHCFSDLFPPPKFPSGDLFQELLTRNFINIQSVLVRKKCVDQVGPFDEKIKLVQDWWYWIQLSRRSQFLYSEQPLARYRIHSGSTNLTQQRAYQTDRYKVLSRVLKQYPDISAALKCQLWYHLGCCLQKLGKKHLSRTFFRHSISLSYRNLGTTLHGIKPLARLVLK